jgi:hypothetical protein
MRHLSLPKTIEQLECLIQTTPKRAKHLEADEFYRTLSYLMLKMDEARYNEQLVPGIELATSSALKFFIKVYISIKNEEGIDKDSLRQKLTRLQQEPQCYGDLIILNICFFIAENHPPIDPITEASRTNVAADLALISPGFYKFLVTTFNVNLPVPYSIPSNRFTHPAIIYARCTHTGRGNLEQRQFYEMYLWSMACIKADYKVAEVLKELWYIANKAPTDIIDTYGCPIQDKANEIVHLHILHQEKRAALNAKHKQEKRDLEAIAKTERTGVQGLDTYIDHWVSIKSCIFLSEPVTSYMPLVNVVRHCPDSLMYQGKKLKRLATEMWDKYQFKATKTLPQAQAMPYPILRQEPCSLPKSKKAVRFADLPSATPPSTPEARSAYFP